ncbi:cytochrome c [Rheinheimera metallidurans]|uniref:c-type cytochrome n=1 Tax=Rheinheimera metallidurans TaxID=2925781 RepID=UPI003002A575
MIRPILAISILLVTSAAAGADAQAGKAKAGVCAACHGSNGISIIPDYPNLAGQKVKYLESAIKAYRDGERKNAIMSPMATGLTEADVANLAAYFASLPVGG